MFQASEKCHHLPVSISQARHFGACQAWHFQPGQSCEFRAVPLVWSSVTLPSLHKTATLIAHSRSPAPVLVTFGAHIIVFGFRVSGLGFRVSLLQDKTTKSVETAPVAWQSPRNRSFGPRALTCGAFLLCNLVPAGSKIGFSDVCEKILL